MGRPQLKASFKCKGSDGRSYRLDVWVTYDDVSTFGDEAQGGKMEESRRDLMVGNLHVNYIEKGKYEIVGSGVTLTCSDPNAP
jgi:hypothetical protein